MLQFVCRISQVFNDPFVGSYTKPGICLATAMMVSCTTSCASDCVRPARIAAWYMSFQYVSKNAFQLSSSFQSFNRLSTDCRVGINSLSSCAFDLHHITYIYVCDI